MLFPHWRQSDAKLLEHQHDEHRNYPLWKMLLEIYTSVLIVADFTLRGRSNAGLTGLATYIYVVKCQV